MTEKMPTAEPKSSEPDDKLTDTELDQVAGGTKDDINPQPLPPHRMPQ